MTEGAHRGDLGPIDCERRRGDEPFHDGGRALGLDLLSFWQWSTSDVVSNATRGVLAEYLVAGALGVAHGCIREEWAAYDLEARDGTRVEVKSAAYIQSWHQERLSQISFLVPKTRGWDRDTNRQDEDLRRKADVYVFALLAHTDQATLDPLDVSQWEFYVLPTQVLDERERSQHSITLPSLRKLAGDAVEFAGLGDAIVQAAGVQRRASSGPSGDAEETHKSGADATRVAAYVRAIADFEMVEDLALPYNHMGATITDAVLQAGLRYETVVWPRVQNVMEAFPEAATTSGFLAVLRERGGEAVVHWTHPEKLGRMEAVAELFIAEGVETETDLRTWLCGDGPECRANVAKLAAVRGMGPKTIDYFKILCGEQDTAAADVHLMRFLEQAAVHVSGYEQAREMVASAAAELGVSAARLDHSIWTYMSKTSGSCDDSQPPPAQLVAGRRDEWGLTGGLTSLESCALDAARHELGVGDAAVRKAANISVRSERRAALLALLRRLDDRRSAAEKLAFQGLDPGSKEYSRATDRFNRSVGALRREIERHLDPAPEVPWREDSSLPQCSSADLEAAIEVLE